MTTSPPAPSLPPPPAAVSDEAIELAASAIDASGLWPRPDEAVQGYAERVAQTALLAALPILRAQWAEEVLTETADTWQCGEWANAPRCPDRVQERIANAQHVTDWLRARISNYTGGTQ